MRIVVDVLCYGVLLEVCRLDRITVSIEKDTLGVRGSWFVVGGCGVRIHFSFRGVGYRDSGRIVLLVNERE